MLGDIVSIATLLLFIIYFIGRVISIIIEKNMKFEIIDVYCNEKDIPKEIKIVEDFKCSDDSNDIMIVTPQTKSYNWVAIYECKYDEEKNKLIKTKQLYKTERIYNDTSLRIDTIISCGIPQYSLEFERNDYMKGYMYLQYNGKNGVEEEMLKFKHTFKSIIYYLFR